MLPQSFLTVATYLIHILFYRLRLGWDLDLDLGWSFRFGLGEARCTFGVATCWTTAGFGYHGVLCLEAYMLFDTLVAVCVV